MDEITEDERKVVDELRKRTIKDVTPKMLEDISLFYRFAKARDFNLTEAEDMLRKHIVWRKEMQIDTILTDYEPPEVLAKYAATSYIGCDKTGCIIRITDCGRIDAKGLWQVVKKTDLEKYAAYITERDKEMMIKRGGNLGKPMYFGIHDFESFTYGNAMSIKTAEYLLHSLKMFVDNYPETIKKIIILNNGWKEVLLKDIDADVLPACYGGNRTDPDGNPLCETFILRGRPIPKSYSNKQKERKMSFIGRNAEKLNIMPFSKEIVTLEVREKNSYLLFEFEVKNRDIDFSLIFRRESVEDFESVEILPKQRVDTSQESEKGYFKCEKVGKYTFVFDNSFSWLHSKEVYYNIIIKGPKDEDVFKVK